MSAEYELVEKGDNDWDKYYDPNTGCYFWWNNTTQTSTWTVPKKTLPNSQINTMLQVDQFLGREQDQSQLTSYLQDDIRPRCLMCQSNENVNDHKYCDNCVALIYNPHKPLISQYKICCKQCNGWGINLVGKNGYCEHCSSLLKEMKPVEKSVVNMNYAGNGYGNTQSRTPFNPCIKCRGWGKDLLVRDGLCNHCINALSKEDFDRKVKKACQVCRGWGLGLVKEDGLCEHCRRLGGERSYLEKRKYGQISGF